MHVERLLSLSNLILVMNMIYQPLLCFLITTQLTYPLTDGRVTINQSGYNKMSLFLIMTNLRMKLILYVKNDYSSILVFLPKFFLYIEDIDFADDLALLSSTKTHIQKKVDRLNKHSEAIGMKTSIKKTKLMRYNAKDQTPVSIDGKDVEDVDNFTYLGAIVNKTGGAEQDITARVGKARSSFNKLTKVWKKSQYSMRTKTRIFNSNVLTVLLYGSETLASNTNAYEKF